MNYAAYDIESFYDKECSITTLGVDGYCLHPKFDAYMVSIATSTGLSYVGHPSKAPWDQISGDDWEWIAHNAAFDARVHHHLLRWNKVASPAAIPRLWHDTADLVAYMGYPRSLKQAVQHLYNTPMSKDTRDKMKGKHWHEMTPEFRAEVEKYAVGDAEWTLRLWQDHGDQWPEHERRLSRQTREMGWRGIRIDQDRLDRGLQLLKTLCWAAEQKIPWVGDGATLSPKLLAEECRKVGIEAPLSLAMDDEGCAEWEARYSAQYPWVGAMRIKRRTNALLKKLEAIKNRLREDGTVPVELKYAGAFPSLRWSGSGGVNFQNLPREEAFGAKWWIEEGNAVLESLVEPVTEGVDLRALLIPRKGKKFGVCDLSQIEPRVSAVVSGDVQSVALMVKGHSPYDAHAVTTGMCTEDELPLKKISLSRYTLAKARELSLGYGSGHHKLLVMALLYVSEEEAERIFTAPVTDAQVRAYEDYLVKVKIPEWKAIWKRADTVHKVKLVNSWLIVQDYRAKKPKTVGMWRKLGEALKSSIGDELEVTLPSGRVQRYAKVASTEGEITVVTPQFGKLARGKIYGGALWNGVVQGTARDVFGECLLRVGDDPRFDIVLHCHDEIVAEMDIETPVSEMARLMTVPPKWLPTLPVDADAQEMMAYTK